MREKGAIVDEVALYDTIKVVSKNRDEIEADLLSGRINIVTFTSSSTVTNFLEMFPTHAPEVLLADVKVAVIGPTTQKTAVENGVKVDVLARETSIESLGETIIGEYQRTLDVAVQSCKICYRRGERQLIRKRKISRRLPHR
ncbi:uroporphyrinogen-III synthase [Candidatus Poribacteria bacterium]|nr:uroporphyrinogen-III synthase [Candidatus Poribacteria bacterium]